MKSQPPHFAFLSCTSHFWLAFPLSLPSLSLSTKIATSVLMAAIADHHQQLANANPPDHRPARRSSGRRKAKGGGDSKKVKQPQRGMGVEKLERLRVQEGLKKMAETLPPAPDPVPATDVLGSPAYLGFQYGQVDVFGNQLGFVGKAGATVVTCYSGHCNSCHKKKKFNGGECGFMGLNNIGEYHHQKMGGVEVVAVHRKGGGGGSSSGHVMMEYEFFPVSCKSDDSEGLVGMKNSRYDDSGFDGHVDLSLKL